MTASAPILSVAPKPSSVPNGKGESKTDPLFDLVAVVKKLLSDASPVSKDPEVREMQRAFELFAARAANLGLWDDQNAPETPLLRNIKILAACMSNNTTSISMEALQELVIPPTHEFSI